MAGTASVRRKTASKVSARERARAAKARLDAQRAEREKRIEDAATVFYEATDRRDVALAEVTVQENAMAQAVMALQADGETVERIAELCGTSPAEIRRLRRLLSPAGSAADDATGTGSVHTEAEPESNGG